MFGEKFGEKRGETSPKAAREKAAPEKAAPARKISFRFLRPISLVLAGLLALALVGESSAARFGGFGGMRSFGGMRATNMRQMRPKTMRTMRPTGSRYTGRNRGGDGYQGRTRYPGNDGSKRWTGRYPGTKVGSHETGHPRYPRYPFHPTWRYPRPNAIPLIPLTPGPAVVPTGVPPTINQAATPPGGGGQGPSQSNQGGNGQRAGFNPPPPGETRFVPNEVLLNVASDVTTPAFDAIARRNRLTRLELREFAATGRRMARVRINDRRPVATVIRSLQAEAGIAGAQPNYLFAYNQGPAPAAGPTQYANTKLHLSEAHALAKGQSIRVAVIDSMIDASHPDLAGTIAATYDATGGSGAKPHFHGTGVAGVIAAHGQLTGAAPSVQLLAITAFNPTDSKARGWDILKGLDWAWESKADVVNMSFAGAEDPEIHNHLVKLRQQGAVLVAAAGNEGPKAQPAYPGSDPLVIAVTATDSDDNLYDHANQGSYIAVAAPGVQILVASPGGSYQMRTGTSFSAPLVSGVVALLLERNRKLDPDAIRAILTSTAQHLGAPGKSDQFGAGLVNAMTAIESATMQSTDVSARGTPAN